MPLTNEQLGVLDEWLRSMYHGDDDEGECSCYPCELIRRHADALLRVRDLEHGRPRLRVNHEAPCCACANILAIKVRELQAELGRAVDLLGRVTPWAVITAVSAPQDIRCVECGAHGQYLPLDHVEGCSAGAAMALGGYEHVAERVRDLRGECAEKPKDCTKGANDV